MAGRESHLLYVRGIPRGEDNTTVVRVGFKCVDDGGELVHALSGVVCVWTTVFGAKVPPLEAVDGT